MQETRIISLAAHRRLREPAAAAMRPPATIGLAVLSAVPGRVRYRVAGLQRSPRLRRGIEASLAGVEGIRSVTASELTGTVLVIFDRAHDGAAIALRLQRAAGHDPGAAVAVRGPAPATRAADRRRSRPAPRRAGAEPPAQDWHRLGEDQALLAVGSSRAGLSATAAAERLARFGPNRLPDAAPRSALDLFLAQFKSLPVALLGASALVSVATGGVADALIIAGVVLINAAIGYLTEAQAERTIKAITAPVHPSANVIRDGLLQCLAIDQIVPGDLVALAPGSYVPADARLIEARHLSVDESALTGESLPVMKETGVRLAAHVPLADRTNMVFMGTQVTGGQGLAVVVATGAASEIGRIQRLVSQAQSPQTPMERQLRVLGNQLVWISGAVCAGVFVVGMLRGYGFVQMLKTAISLAVAAVPEGLPTVATTTLALGLRQMRGRKVLIRHLEAVETLGSVQVVCLDKTGTLTLNRMAVVAAQLGSQRLVVGNGRFFAADGSEIDPYRDDALLRLLHVAVLCNETELNGPPGQPVLHGSATENALVRTALDAGVDVAALRARHPRRRVDYRSESRLYMRTVHDAGARRLLAVKGSPPEVLALCATAIRDGREVPLTEALRRTILDANAQMAGEALRVLAFAYALTDDDDVAGGCVFLGLLGMMDPVREGVRGLIGEFHAAGIDTVMITGDQSPTAYAIGRALRLSGHDGLDVLDSSHLETLDPEALQALAQRVHVFARVSPSHKLAIVQALQRAGRVVAMTGDGINDGPALKVADIGVAMGHTGTEVARTVADVVLEEDNLETLILAVSQGRTIYNNIRKSVHFLLSTNLSEITVMFSSIALGLGQPLNPMQLLWINLVTDIFPGLALALEPPEPDVLRRPPRDPGEPIVRHGDFARIGFESAAISAGTLAAYGYGVVRYGIGPQAGTLAFMSLTGAQLLHAVSSRSAQRVLFGGHARPPNRYLQAAVGGSFALQLATLLPGLRGLLGLGPVGLIDAAVIAAGAGLPFLVNEATKAAPAGATGAAP